MLFSCCVLVVPCAHPVLTCYCAASVNIPKDKVSLGNNGYAFVEFATEVDADYALKVLNGVKLCGKPIKMNKSKEGGRAAAAIDVGANLFIGNLDPDVDEKLVTDTFKPFGNIISPAKVCCCWIAFVHDGCCCCRWGWGLLLFEFVFIFLFLLVVGDERPTNWCFKRICFLGL